MGRPTFETAHISVYQGDALTTLRSMADGSVDCCVTSPPYWGLRDYGVAGQLGLEPTPALYVERMVEVFREVRRVLRPRGTLWLNLGDSYVGSVQGVGAAKVTDKQASNAGSDHFRQQGIRPPAEHVDGMKAKDMVGIPWMVAFALRADGWYLRSDIIWSKPNPMPESVTDRPTKAHEYVFLLSKSNRYFFDQEAVREPNTGQFHPSGKPWLAATEGIVLGRKTNPNGGLSKEHGTDAGRNIRSVWNIATQPYPEAHFATFPRELPERCIKAGCPEQVCATCGKARERLQETTYNVRAVRSKQEKHYDTGETGARANMPFMGDAVRTTTGWTDCGHNTYVPGVVLDPFAGSGTTLAVARDLGRKSIGIELSPEYVRLIEKRCAQMALELGA